MTEWTTNSKALLEGRRQAVANGYKASGTIPFGYKRGPAEIDDDGRIHQTIVPDPEDAPKVATIFRLYLRHRSIEKVIRALVAAGIPATRRGGPWSRAGISWILHNDTYIGRTHFGPVRARGRHDPIVAPIVFYKAQKLIRKNNKRNRPAASDAAPAAA